jgi:hypothetical protein
MCSANHAQPSPDCAGDTDATTVANANTVSCTFTDFKDKADRFLATAQRGCAARDPHL